MILNFFEDKEYTKQAEDNMDAAISRWEEEARRIGIQFVDAALPIPPKPLLITRYTLDKMDSEWNKILENEKRC
jgi:hypothetical protein